MYWGEKGAYYGEKYGGIFDYLPFEYADMYDEMDISLHRYCSLQWKHRADLKAYALMFRNVDIDNCSIIDKVFFLNRSNEIIGYKDKVYSANASVKAKLVKYYLEYDFLFEMYYKNQLEEGMTTIVRKNCFPFSIDALYNKFKAKQFDTIYSINNLTDQKCLRLISNIHELEAAVTNDIYHINVIPRYDNFEKFVKEIALPYILGKHHRQRYVVYEDCFGDYAKKYCRNDRLDVIPSREYDHIKDIYLQLTQDDLLDKYTNTDIEVLRRKKLKLEEPLEELSKLRFSSPFLMSGDVRAAWQELKKKEEELRPTIINFPLLGESDEECAARKEKQEERCKQEIERIKREIARIQREEEKERLKEIAHLESITRDNVSQIFKIDEEIAQIRSQIRKELENEYDKFVTTISSVWLDDPSNVWKYMFEHQDSLHIFISNYIKSIYVQNKRSQAGDDIDNKMKLYRTRNIWDYVTYISNPQNKRRFEDCYKRRIELSFQEKVCYNKRWARLWVDYIKSILAEKEERERKLREEEKRKLREVEEKRLEPFRFNIRNRHWRDGNVSFREADHVYIVDGTPLDSVTTFVKNCFPEFDSEYHAKRKAEALGITKEAVLEMWDKKERESREQGTTMHRKIESYYLSKSVSSDETFELFKIFANKITLKPYRTEWAVYDWEQKIAGTIDFVDYQNGEYIIYDWKRSDKLIAKNGLPIKNSQYGEKALPPIENLDDSPYYHYALQLSLYKYILEKNYDITVSKLRLGIFHPSYNKPYVLEMPYLQNEIDTLFGLRSEVFF